MPKHAVKNLLPDRVLNLEQIAAELVMRASELRPA
jgi:hypothetical protein